MLRTCCEWLTNYLETAGEKGFSVYPFHEGDRRRFVLQGRPLDPEGVAAWGAAKVSPGQPPIALAVSMDLPLTYCPRCGTDLIKLIEEQREEFDKAAEAVRHLVS